MVAPLDAEHAVEATSGGSLNAQDTAYQATASSQDATEDNIQPLPVASSSNQDVPVSEASINTAGEAHASAAHEQAPSGSSDATAINQTSQSLENNSNESSSQLSSISTDAGTVQAAYEAPGLSKDDINRIMESHYKKLTGNGTEVDLPGALAGLHEMSELLDHAADASPQVRPHADTMTAVRCLDVTT
jgi:hypothetical protein